MLLSTFVGAAAAQPMNEEQRRAGARALYMEGAALKQAGKCNEAVEKFQGANRLYEAPTSMLNIAECQATLGKLVEAAESYRSLARMQERTDWSPAFIAARRQGAGELAALEPRIPTLAVDVDPKAAPGLKLQFDGTPLDPAFVGVARPVNPGEHRVGVSATGYAQADQTIAVRERDNRRLPFRLVAVTGGGLNDPSTPANTGVGTVPGEPAPYVPPPAPGTPTPPPGSTPPPPPAPKGPVLVFTGQLGGGLPVGSGVGDLFGAGLNLGLSAAIRFDKQMLGLDADFSYFSAKTNVSLPGGVGNGDVKGTLTNGLVGVSYSFYTNPVGSGAFLRVGLGYGTTSASFGGGAKDVAYSGLGGAFYGDLGYAIGLGQNLRGALVGWFRHNRPTFGAGVPNGNGAASTSAASEASPFTIFGLALRAEFDTRLM
jgi:hypothetical protein